MPSFELLNPCPDFFPIIILEIENSPLTLDNLCLRKQTHHQCGQLVDEFSCRNGENPNQLFLVPNFTIGSFECRVEKVKLLNSKGEIFCNNLIWHKIPFSPLLSLFNVLPQMVYRILSQYHTLQ